MLLDRYAWNNALRAWHPLEKVSMALGGMVVIWAFDRPGIGLAVFLLFSLLIICGAGVKLKDYFCMLLWPSAFLAVGIVAIVISYEPSVPSFVSLKIAGTTWGVTQQGLHQAGRLCARVLGMISAMYFLCVTTPIVEITALLRMSKAPGVLGDVMFIMYRTLYLLSGTVEQTARSQTLRLGYSIWRRSISSVGYLMGHAWQDALRTARENTAAMLVRGSDCTIPDLAIPAKLSVFRISVIYLVCVSSLLVAFLT